MAADYKFVDNPKELKNSTLEFYFKPEYWKAALGSSPKYFVHILVNGKHAFGLSKFCAFKNITVEDYLTKYRYKIGGGSTQKHISWITHETWVPRARIKKEIRDSFDNWILEFIPNYNLNNAYFISLKLSKSLPNKKKASVISPEELQERLNLQIEIGEIGEAIALSFELDRLSNQGIKHPGRYVEQVSKRNSAAGYDIFSSTDKENRYIEVKSSLNNNYEFIITENEVQTLEKFGDEAYLYFVHVKDLIKREGNVINVFSDPIAHLKQNGSLKPIAYRAQI